METRIEITSQILSMAKMGAINFLKEDAENGKKVYQSWLGFYNSRTKDLKMDKVLLVQTANQWASAVLGCRQPPRLERKTVGKMGLKGVPGLLLE